MEFRWMNYKDEKTGFYIFTTLELTQDC
jgi:hypothetical protein